MANKVPKCFICNKQIYGQYYFDWAGHSICASHIQNITKCASCGQFCDNHAKDIGIGMRICTHCQKYRIERKDSDSIVQFVNSIYRSTPIGNITHWKLMMVDAETLYKKTKDKNTRGLAQAVGSEYTIFIYRELSRVAFAQVLAHEMLHVYQYTNRINPPKHLCEGFCNLGSYLVLQEIGNSEAKGAMRNLEESPDEIYGDGFRIIKNEYEKNGLESVIKMITHI